MVSETAVRGSWSPRVEDGLTSPELFLAHIEQLGAEDCLIPDGKRKIFLVVLSGPFGFADRSPRQS